MSRKRCIIVGVVSVFLILVSMSAEASLSIIPADVSVKPADTIQLDVTGGCAPYNYNSTNPNALGVSSTGLVTGNPTCTEGSCLDPLYVARPSGEGQEICVWTDSYPPQICTFIML